MASPSFPTLLASAVPISQGAEAKVYQARLSSDATPIVLKYRFQKTYRHPSLDASITRARVAGEARTLLKCFRAGVNVPGIRMVDAAAGALGIEWIEGKSVRRLLPGGETDEEEHGDEPTESAEEFSSAMKEFDLSLESLMHLIGIELGKMHSADVIHGDLTTSNMMLRHPSTFKSSVEPSRQLVLIDFGLSFISSLVEDKAVDLYVLERAFASTHPDSEPLFSLVLDAYANQMGKEWTAISRRLDDVRLRGRKRSMVG